MGIATKSLRSWEFGTSQPSQQQLDHLAKTLNLETTQFRLQSKCLER
jgi:DNA-binding transcriptional regulator YiaG